MCAAIPVGLLLLFLLGVGTVYRFFRPTFPNAMPLVILMNDLLVDTGELDEMALRHSFSGRTSTEH